jgi:hypothetical protein
VENGVASVAEPADGEVEPLVQVTLTLTEAPLSGTKSLFTWKAPTFCSFTMVHKAAPPFVTGTLAQRAWLAV